MKQAKVNLDGGAVTLLSPLITGVTSLALRCREAHWNVKGPNFGPLHELFGSFYDFMNDWADTIAERVVQQGGVAASLATFDGPPMIGDEKTLLEGITFKANAMAEIIHAVIPQLGDDETTKDVLIEFGRELEKWIWKIEAHLMEFKRLEPAPDMPKLTTANKKAPVFSAVITDNSILVKAASGHIYAFDENSMPTSKAKDPSEQDEAQRWLQENFDEILDN